MIRGFGGRRFDITDGTRYHRDAAVAVLDDEGVAQVDGELAPGIGSQGDVGGDVETEALERLILEPFGAPGN